VINKDKFNKAVARAMSYRSSGKIGTLGEKHLHRALKYYFEPDEDKHEVAYLGAVADIKNERGIIEIQTRSFNKLIPKLERFLDYEDVEVVLPIIEGKTICRIDPESGETKSIRKSPKKGKASDCLPEIDKIRKFLPHQRLKITLIFLDATEIRLANERIKVGRKRTDKIDCIPDKINSVMTLYRADEYISLLPIGLPRSFTAAEFEDISGLSAIDKHSSLMLLMQLGIITREKNDKRTYVYSIKDSL
jgi:hypothetical protein